jgi:hypothetical protein
LPPGSRVRFDLTSKKIPLAASQNLIAKLFGQQPLKICSSMMRKLRIHDLVAMVKYAIKIGIIDLEILHPPKRLSNAAILCNMYGGQSILPYNK